MIVVLGGYSLLGIIILHFPGYAPITVITFLDKLKTEEEKVEVFDKASMVTGSSGERTYFIANYTHGNTVQSNEMDLLALEILDSSKPDGKIPKARHQKDHCLKKFKP